MDLVQKVPTGDMFAKVAAVAGNFLRFNETYANAKPPFRMVFYCDEGLKALQKWGRIVHIDGTFNILKDPSLVLSSLICLSLCLSLFISVLFLFFSHFSFFSFVFSLLSPLFSVLSFSLCSFFYLFF